MLPDAAVLQKAASVIIELGTSGILDGPHVDILCDGIGDLAARSVTDWRVAGRAMTAVELVTVFGQNSRGNDRDCSPGDMSVDCKRQLGRQLIRLTDPERRDYS